MTTLNFPNAPLPGERYTAPNGARYQWSGQVWFSVESDQTDAGPGEWVARVTGDAVLQPDGTWKGTDLTVPLRSEWLQAKSLGLILRILPGYYIVTDAIVKTGEAFDNCGVRGTQYATWLIQKTGAQAANFALFTFDGVLEQDGFTAVPNPTLYLTEPGVASSDIIRINDVSQVKLGMPLMLMDMTNGINEYFDGGLAGTKVANFGQVSQIVQLGTDPPASRNVLPAGSTYDNTTGDVVLKVDQQITIGQNVFVRVSGLTGTGDNLQLLAGSYRTLTGTGGNTILYNTADSLGADITITGGLVEWGVLAADQVRIRPALEANYAGTAVSPLTNSTCIRRMSSAPENVTFSGITIGFDLLAPPKGTQSKVLLRALKKPKVFDCEFHGPGYSVNVVNGTYDFEVRGCLFVNGGNAMYCISMSAVYLGRVLWCRAYNCRHLTNTASTLQTSTTAHITVLACQGIGNALSTFTDHPGVRDMVFYDCESIGNTGGSISAGYQLRGMNEAVVNCRAYGCYYGVNAAASRGAVIDGGLYSGCVVAIHVARAPITVMKNEPRIINSTNYGVLIDNAVDDSALAANAVRDPALQAALDALGVILSYDYAEQQDMIEGPNGQPLRVLDSPAYDEVRDLLLARFGIPLVAVPYQLVHDGVEVNAVFDGPSGIADVAVVNRSSDRPAVYGENWRFRCRAPGRAGGVKYLMVQKSNAHSAYTFPGEYAVGVGTKYASWTVVAGLPATYIMDSSVATQPIVATIPDPAKYPASRHSFTKPNVGGQPCSLTGYPVSGVVNPVIPDGGTYNLLSTVQLYPVANTPTNTYNPANGAVLMLLQDSTDLVTGMKVTISGATGTGADINSLNGTFTLNAGSFGKQLRFTAPVGKVITSITGGTASSGSWVRT